MQVLTIGTQKGGAGKSTTAIHLAVQASRDGKRVVLVDMDPQGSIAAWARRRDQAEGDALLILQTTPGSLPGVLDMARGEGIDLVIIDTPPHAGGAIDMAFRRADFVVIPVRPGPFDIDAAGSTVAILRSSGRKGAFLMSQVPPRGTEADDTAALLGENYADIPTLETRLTTRKAFMRALIDGRSVSEFEPGSSKSVMEISSLYSEIMERMK